MIDLIVFQPPPGAWKAFDTAGDDHSPGYVVTEDISRQAHAEGYRAIFRYSRPDGVVHANPKPGGDWQGVYHLSLAERDWILTGGCAIGLVQFGVFGDADYGTRNGHNASIAARKLGAPKGLTHFMDVEGRGPEKAGANGCKLYAEQWAAGNNAGGDRTGKYRTGQVPLSARQTYALRGVTCYWAAAGPQPPNPAPRGDAVQQGFPTKICGMAADPDIIRTDNFGDGPYLLGTPEICAAWYAEAMAITAGQLGQQLTQ